MTALIHSRNGMRRERLSRLPSPPRFHGRGGQLPSDRYGCRWGSLPVEGSKAWRDSQPILSRLFQR